MAILLCDVLKLNPVLMEACKCSMGGDGMDIDFLAALEASKATKADEDFKRAQDASLEGAGEVSRIVKELRSNRSATASFP